MLIVSASASAPSEDESKGPCTSLRWSPAAPLGARAVLADGCSFRNLETNKAGTSRTDMCEWCLETVIYNAIADGFLLVETWLFHLDSGLNKRTTRQKKYMCKVQEAGYYFQWSFFFFFFLALAAVKWIMQSNIFHKPQTSYIHIKLMYTRNVHWAVEWEQRGLQTYNLSSWFYIITGYKHING